MKRPTLTVILATIEPWPDLERCLSVLEPQVEALGAEIIVGDGHGGALEARYAESPSLQWIRAPGASVFDLRAQALEMARGEIVAVTEDHCVVASDWCQQILRSLEDAPDKMAMTGPVMNGSTDRLSDWANYLHTFGCFHPPVDAGQRDRCPPAANVAYRRKVIPAGSILAGWMELELTPRLFAEGLFGVCDGMTVTHVQSHGFWKTLLAHFDNGRTTTGLHHISLSQRQLPWFLFRETVRGLDRSQSPRPIIRKSLPLLFLLSTCHALGEVLGILAGPGESPRRLR